MLSGSDCGNIFIWDKNTEVIVQKKKADVKGVVSLNISTKGIVYLL